MAKRPPTRLTFYHICGAEVFAESVQNQHNEYYHYVYYGKVSGGSPLAVCVQCSSRVGATSVRKPGEQLRAIMAAEELELELGREAERQAEAEEGEADA